MARPQVNLQLQVTKGWDGDEAMLGIAWAANAMKHARCMLRRTEEGQRIHRMRSLINYRISMIYEHVKQTEGLPLKLKTDCNSLIRSYEYEHHQTITCLSKISCGRYLPASWPQIKDHSGADHRTWQASLAVPPHDNSTNSCPPQIKMLGRFDLVLLFQCDLA